LWSTGASRGPRYRQHKAAFGGRLHTEDGSKVIISLATLEPEVPTNSEYLIDIDALAETSPLDDLTQIIAIVEKLHTITGAVFETLITDNTRGLLDAP
jgi:uncharacterized protein (TIGR04255 family)